MGVTNAVTIDADGMQPLTLVGPGAGGMATASAVVADIGDIARGRAHRRRSDGRSRRLRHAVRKAPMQRHEGGYYIRLPARDRPGDRGGHRHAPCRTGDFARIDRAAPRPEDRGNEPKGAVAVPVILITYATTEDAVRKPLHAVRSR